MIPWIDHMIEAHEKMGHGEEKRARLVSEPRRAASHDAGTHLWHWDVEPGMEEAFNDLLGWMLSSQQDAAAKVKPAAHDSPISSERETLPEAATVSRRASGWARCAGLCCGQAS